MYIYIMCVRAHVYIYIYIHITYAQHKCGMLCALNNDRWVVGVYLSVLPPLPPEGGAGAHVLEGQILVAPRA